MADRADHVELVEIAEIFGIVAADQEVEAGMDQKLLGLRQDVVAVRAAPRRVTEVLHQLGGFRVHADIAEQPDLEHAGEDVAGDRVAAALFRGEQPVVLLGQVLPAPPAE